MRAHDGDNQCEKICENEIADASTGLRRAVWRTAADHAIQDLGGFIFIDATQAARGTECNTDEEIPSNFVRSCGRVLRKKLFRSLRSQGFIYCREA